MLRLFVGTTICAATLCVFPAASQAQTVSPKWEELTAEDFITAIRQADGVCVLPFGIVEKHGPAGPLGTDLINIRFTVLAAVRKEYALVFPEYYFGQIFEAQHQPGTIAYSSKLQMQMLEETVEEMARNGCQKIVIANGHGGNDGLLQFFITTQLESPHNYVVYAWNGLGGSNANDIPPAARPSRPGVDGHAGENEVANVMASRPDLGHPDRGSRESGANLQRLDLPAGVSTAISWYSMYPNHYMGDASGATATRGTASVEYAASQFAQALRAIKEDVVAPRLQKEFFDLSRKPLETKQ
jgi:creatinine amidohydrolase